MIGFVLDWFKTITIVFGVGLLAFLPLIIVRHSDFIQQWWLTAVLVLIGLAIAFAGLLAVIGYRHRKKAIRFLAATHKQKPRDRIQSHQIEHDGKA